jgi:hypothetical protein
MKISAVYFWALSSLILCLAVQPLKAQDDMAPVPYSSGPSSRPAPAPSQQQGANRSAQPSHTPAFIAVPMSWLSSRVRTWLDQQYDDIKRDIGFWMATGKSYSSATQDERATYDAGRLITTDRDKAIDYVNDHVVPGMGRVADPNDTTDPTQTNYDNNQPADPGNGQTTDPPPDASSGGGNDHDDDDGS